MPPLQKQVISIPLEMGIDTKTPSVLVAQNKFMAIENAVFDKGQTLGAIHKRNGYSALTSTITDGSSFNAQTLATFSNSQTTQQELLAQRNDGELLSYQASAGAWEPKASLITTIQATERSIYQSNNNSTNCTSAWTTWGVTTSPVGCYAWIDGLGQLWASVIDETTGSSYGDPFLLIGVSGSGAPVEIAAANLPVTGPRVISVTTENFYVWAGVLSGGTQTIYVFSNTSTPYPGNTWAEQTTFSCDAAPFDVCEFNSGTVALVYQVSGDSIARIMNGSLTSFANNTLSTSPISQVCCCPGFTVSGAQDVFIALSQFTTGSSYDINWWVVSGSATTNYSGTAYTGTKSKSLGICGNIPNNGPGNITLITLIVEHLPAEPGNLPTSATGVQFGTVPTIVTHDLVTFSRSSGTPTVSVVEQAWSGVQLASNPWVHGLNGGVAINFIGLWPSTTQETYFWMRMLASRTGDPVTSMQQIAPLFAGNAGTPVTTSTNFYGRLPIAWQPTGLPISGQMTIACCVSPQGSVDINGTLAPLLGISELFVSDTAGPIQTTQTGDTLLLASGGQVYGYDGTNCVEQGFPIFPEQPAANFLTSYIQLVTCTAYNPVTGQPASTMIFVPDHPTDPGGCIGSLFHAGEYMVFGETDGGIWFNVVGGSGSPPSFMSSFTLVNEVTISEAGTAYSIASSISLALHSASGTGILDNPSRLPGYAYAPVPISYSNGTQVFTGYGVQVMMAGTGTAGEIAPMNQLSALLAIQINRGSTSPTISSSFLVTGCPGDLIAPGAYFTFWQVNPNSLWAGASPGIPQPLYVWFTVDGIGTDPKPNGFYNEGVKVVVLSTDSETTVASKMVSAINFLYPTGGSGDGSYGVVAALTIAGGPILTVTGPVLSTKQTLIGTTASDSSHDADNPENIGVGTQALGTPVGGVIGTNVTTSLAYSYANTFAWTDAAGQINLSAPSTPLALYVPVLLPFLTSLTLEGNIGAGSSIVVSVTQASQQFAAGDSIEIVDGANSETVTVKSGGEGVGQFTATSIANPHSAGVTLVWASFQTAPSLISVVQPANAIAQIIPWPLPTSLSTKPNVAVQTYRTIADGEDYFLASPPATIMGYSPTPANPETITAFVDKVSDADLTALTPLYTTGGTVEHDALPSASIVINHQDRAWLAGIPDAPNEIWYSTELSSEEGIAFSDEQIIALNTGVGTVNAGQITGLASMDGNLIVFQQQRIWTISGTGPDAAGNGQSFSNPQLVSGTVGCRDTGSISLLPNGVLFKSTQGFYLIDRGLQLQYIGIDVAAYNADVVSDARTIDGFTQVRLLSVDGTTLIYDYGWNQWGTLESHNGSSSTIWNGSYIYANSEASLAYLEDPGVYSDNGAGFPLAWTSAFFQLAGLNGYQRIWQFFIQGQFYAGQEYRVTVAYDDDPNVVDTFNFVPQYNCNAWKFYPSRQLCKSMQIGFTDVAPYGTTETPWVDGIDLVVGLRPGAQKIIGAAQSSG